MRDHAPISTFEYPSAEVLEDPFPFYAALREEAPAHQLPTGEFLVSRYDDVAAAARNAELFSNFIGPSNPGLNGDFGLDVDASGRFTPWQMPFSDPPEHRLKRALGQPLTSPKRLRSFEPIVGRHVDTLIDGFAGRGAVEFKAEFAEQLPVNVVNEVFGLVTQPYQEKRQATGERRIVGNGVGSRLASPEEKAALKAAARERAAYYRQAILKRLEQPTDDYTSFMLQTKMQRDGEIDLAYMTVELMNFHNAGIGTTAHMLASAVMLLLHHPEEVAALQADHTRAGRVIDEVLRLECPVQWLQRIARADTEIAGVAIPEGSVVLLLWAAANRDPARFEDPDRFWPDRPGAIGDRIMGSLSFGHGIHTCVGGPLARLEGKVSLVRLLDRLPGLRLTDENDGLHILNLNHRAPMAVHIGFDDVLRGSEHENNG